MSEDCEQVTLRTGRTVDVEEACEILEVDPIIRRFGTWAVTTYGIECLISRYHIPADRVREDWKYHLVGPKGIQQPGFWVMSGILHLDAPGRNCRICRQQAMARYYARQRAV